MDGTVLVADDDRTIRTVLTQALTRAGCKVHATSSLVTLMRWVEEGKGDLVISDVVMPDGNGLEALPRITRMRPALTCWRCSSPWASVAKASSWAATSGKASGDSGSSTACSRITFWSARPMP